MTGRQPRACRHCEHSGPRYQSPPRVPERIAALRAILALAFTRSACARGRCASVEFGRRPRRGRVVVLAVPRPVVGEELGRAAPTARTCLLHVRPFASARTGCRPRHRGSTTREAAGAGSLPPTAAKRATAAAATPPPTVTLPARPRLSETPTIPANVGTAGLDFNPHPALTPLDSYSILSSEFIMFTPTGTLRPAPAPARPAAPSPGRLLCCCP